MTSRANRGPARNSPHHCEKFPGAIGSRDQADAERFRETRRGRFLLMGFAGNSAPDHVDHFHAMAELLRRHAPEVLRAVGQGYASGLEGIVRQHGVNVG